MFILRLVHSQALDGSRPSALTVEKKNATVSIFAEFVYLCLCHLKIQHALAGLVDLIEGKVLHPQSIAQHLLHTHLRVWVTS